MCETLLSYCFFFFCGCKITYKLWEKNKLLLTNNMAFLRYQYKSR
uniref:Uncharacterized protein n=1 Tax=Anguilla anguilla TaxID=7936 RepID=A0A0E9Q0C3_ANGAN